MRLGIAAWSPNCGFHAPEVIFSPTPRLRPKKTLSCGPLLPVTLKLCTSCHHSCRRRSGGLAQGFFSRRELERRQSRNLPVRGLFCPVPRILTHQISLRGLLRLTLLTRLPLYDQGLHVELPKVDVGPTIWTMDCHDNDATLVPHSLESVFVPRRVDQHVDLSKFSRRFQGGRDGGRVRQGDGLEAGGWIGEDAAITAADVRHTFALEQLNDAGADSTSGTCRTVNI